MTDYQLCGPVNAPLATRAASNDLRDHKRIAWSKQPWQRFRPAETLLPHSRSRTFIANALNTRHYGTTIVITHHAPHPRSLHPRYSTDLLSGAHASNPSGLVGRTRIVCNPPGYGRETLAFDLVVIEVGE